MQEAFIWKPDEGPTTEQLDIFDRLIKYKRVAVRGPHGLGKTTLAAWAILWFANVWDGEDWKIPTTASAWRQLNKFLWPEVHKWARRLNWEFLGRLPYDPRSELLGLSLKLTTGEAFAVASDVPELIEGAHADHLLYIFDEAKIIPAATFDAAEGAFSGGGIGQQEAYALAISTPGPPEGRFYDIHSCKPGYDDWNRRHVTLEESIKSGRIGRVWAVQRAKQWGVTSAIYKNRALGEFAASESDSVIPLEWVEAAIERWRAWRDSVEIPLVRLTSVGADIARSGADTTVLALRQGSIIVEFRRTSYADTMVPVGMIGNVLRRYKGIGLIDIIGIGAGVYDRLKEVKSLELQAGKKPQWGILPFNAAAKAASIGPDGTEQPLTDRSEELQFLNLRAASMWHLRELLDPAYPEETIMLPDDDLMIGDLTAAKWKVNSSGKIQIEPKEDIKKRLGRSPDTGDAVMQAFSYELLMGDQTEQDIWGGSLGMDEKEPLMATIQREGMYWPADVVPDQAGLGSL
jgi:hypothetical protein